MKLTNLKPSLSLTPTSKQSADLAFRFSNLSKRRKPLPLNKQSNTDLLTYTSTKSHFSSNNIAYPIYEEQQQQQQPSSSYQTIETIQSLALTYFKKPRRTYQENQVFITYLFNLSPFNQIISESAGKAGEDIIRTLSYSLKYEYIKQNHIVFKYGDVSDKYYLILRGQVDMIVPNEEEVMLNEIEYYDYLLKLREYNEMKILNKVIAKNNECFNIIEKTFDIWVKKAYNTLKVMKYGVRLRMLHEISKRNLNKERKQTTPPHERRRDTLTMPFDISLNEEGKSKKQRRQSMINTATTMKTRYSFMNDNDINDNHNKHNERSSTVRDNYKTILNTDNDDNEIDNVYTIFDSLELRNLTLQLETQIIRTIHAIDPLCKDEQELFPNFNEIINNNNINNSTTIESYVNRTKPIKHPCDSSIRKKVTIITYFPANSLKTGETFGEMCFDADQTNSLSRRVRTVITSEPCHFGTLNKQTYDKCLKAVSEKTRKAKLNFFFKLNLFKTCDRNLFMKNFYNFFTKKTMTHPQTLFNQNEHLDKSNRRIYFIRDGEFSSTCNISLNEINKLLIKYNYDKVVPIEEDIETESFKHKKMHNIVLDEKRQELYNNKHKVKLQFFRENDIVGFDDCIVDGKYLYECKCNSVSATVYEIHINYFKMMLSMDDNIKERMKMQENIKRNLMIKMLLKYKRTRIDLFNYKDTHTLYNNNANKRTKNKALMTIENQFNFKDLSNTINNKHMNDSIRKSPQSKQVILSKAIMDTFKLNKQKEYMCLSGNNTLSIDTHVKTTSTNVLENTLLKSKCDNTISSSGHLHMISNYNNKGVMKGKRSKYVFPSLKKSLPFKVKESLVQQQSRKTFIKYNTITTDICAKLTKNCSRNRQSCSLYAVTKANQNELSGDNDDGVEGVKSYQRYVKNNNNGKVLLPCKPSKYLSGKKTKVLLNTLPGFFYLDSKEPKNILNINKKGMFMFSFKSN